MDISVIIGSNIKRMRSTHGLSQVEIAELLSIDSSVYSRIESGKTMISSDKLHTLSKYFNVPIDKFYEGLGSNIQNNYDNSQVNSNVQINYGDTEQKMSKDINEIKDLLKELILVLSKK